MEFSDPSVTLIRGTFPTGQSGIRRVTAYLSFHIKAFIHILNKNPDVIFYIEPHSAFPVFLSRLVFRRTRIFIHYHEYHSPEEFFKPGMRMAKWFHHLEKSWLYPVATWVSQTNETRLKLFLGDNPEINLSNSSVLPNFPPLEWWRGDNKAWAGEQHGNDRIRLVYVGSLSRADTFIEEAVEWLKELGPAIATFDIYSYNLHTETRTYLKGVTDAQIRFHEKGVDYDELPRLLRGFHVGLILYKGNTPNYTHNASNKLFEYLSCGLDVIYPKQMMGVRPFVNVDSRPRVIECDFEKLDEFSYQLLGRQQLPPADMQLDCESELTRLERAMLDSL